MCNKKQFKYCPSRIDTCMKLLIEFINEMNNTTKTLACCCGHGKYNMTIVIKDEQGNVFDLLSDVGIQRKKMFYKRDERGYYFIPEVEEYWRRKNATM